MKGVLVNVKVWIKLAIVLFSELAAKPPQKGTIDEYGAAFLA